MSRITVDKRSMNSHSNRYVKQTNPIIYGYFPHKTYNEIAINRINRTLSLLLGFLILLSIISYYFATASEMELNKIGKETIKLNNENVELQNKLDNLHSYNKVDLAVRRSNLLNTAKQVIEVPAASTTIKDSKTLLSNNSTLPYKWSIGY